MIEGDGTVVWESDYDAFGEATVTTTTVESNLRFPGQYYDAETGLHYNWHRTYDTVTGRYLQADPLGIDLGGLNLYVYSGSNPVNLVDPWGLFDKRALRNTRFRAIAGLGASKLAEYATRRMEPGKARGAVYLASSALATVSAAEATVSGIGSYAIAGTTAETGLGMAGGYFIGSVYFAVAAADVNIASDNLQNAFTDFGWVETDQNQVEAWQILWKCH